jgi:ribosome-associated protein
MKVSEDLTIPDEEISFATSRSSGPGGQNVNKVESRVTLLFDLDASPSLTDDQKRLVRARLSSRINKAGVLRVVAQKHRTQRANLETASERFVELLAEALTERTERKPTRVSKAVRRRRVEDKRRRGELKRRRRERFDG